MPLDLAYMVAMGCYEVEAPAASVCMLDLITLIEMHTRNAMASPAEEALICHSAGLSAKKARNERNKKQNKKQEA
eukprot:8976553-Ditylum_brightwellii.AAC.2